MAEIGDRVRARRINGEWITGTWRGPLGGDRAGFDLVEDTDCSGLPRCAVVPHSVQVLPPIQGELLRFVDGGSQYAIAPVVVPVSDSPRVQPTIGTSQPVSADAVLDDVLSRKPSDSPRVGPTIGTSQPLADAVLDDVLYRKPSDSSHLGPTIGTSQPVVGALIRANPVTGAAPITGRYLRNSASGCLIIQVGDSQRLCDPGSWSLVEPIPVPVPEGPEKKFSDFWHNVQEYQSKGCWYFRYVWGVGSKVKNIHIRGGSTRNPIAKKNAALVQAAIDRGDDPLSIEKFLR